MLTMDYIIRGTAAEGQIRFFATTTKDTVEKARTLHNMSPVATAAIGRLMSAAVMMGSDMKNEKDLITLTIKGNGPLGGIVVTSDSKARVKGYVHNPDVDIPLNEKGKLDVSGAIGLGVLTVIKDIGLKEPYVGQTHLVSGEIAEDLTYYYASSEQIPTVVALGVLIDKDYSVKQSGGFIIQLMPGAQDELINKLEESLKDLQSVTQMLEQGHTPETIINTVLDGFDITIHDRIETQFYCNCSKERVERALISVGKKDLQEMIDEGKPVELNCHFCNEKYIFTVDELKEMAERV